MISPENGRAISRPYRVLPLLVTFLLVAAGLRIGGLGRDARFTGDEAYYAHLSRVMVLEQDFRLYEAVTDKPPVTFLLVGTSLALLGESEFAARVPNVFLSLIGLCLLYRLAKRLSSERAALIALALMVVSPLEITYAVSVFQDTPMMVMLIAALWQASRGKWGKAGFFLGLATVMKPTGIWFALLVLSSPPSPLSNVKPLERGSLLIQHWVRFGFGLFLPIGSVLGWDATRPQSFFALGSANNNPGRFIRSDEVWSRAEIWAGHFYHVLPLWGWVLFGFGIVMTLYRSKRIPPLSLRDISPAGRGEASHPSISTPLIVAVVAYMTLHWWVAFNTYERYLLPLAPLVAILIATMITKWEDKTPLPLLRWGLGVRASLCLFILLSLPAAHRSAQRDLNPDHHAINTLADTLNRDYAGRIVYDYWLGWDLSWYLGGDTTVWVVYFSTPEELAYHLQTEHGERFFVAPSAEDAAMWLNILNANGIQTRLVYQVDDLVLYSVIPSPFGK